MGRSIGALILTLSTMHSAVLGLHTIVDVAADIRDLDVGDVDDFTSDMPHRIVKEIRVLKEHHERLAG